MTAREKVSEATKLKDEATGLFKVGLIVRCLSSVGLSSSRTYTHQPSRPTKTGEAFWRGGAGVRGGGVVRGTHHGGGWGGDGRGEGQGVVGMDRVV